MKLNKLIVSLGTAGCCTVLLILLNCSWPQTEAAGYLRNGEIFNIGWIFSLPYDIGNTLRAPLAGPLSLILTAGLSIVLFFGLVASPVYYLFGTPKRKYHQNDAIQTKPAVVPAARSFHHPLDFINFNSTQESRSFARSYMPDQDDTTAKQQHNFLQNFFFFVPDDLDENCRKLLVCHSHGFLTILPTYLLHIYRIFSRRTAEIPPDYQEAIQIGLSDQADCVRQYSNCTRDPTEIAQETLYYLFADPDDCNHS